MSAVIEGIVQKAAPEIARCMDAAILGAVEARIGRYPNLTEMFPRLRLVRRVGETFDLMYLDDLPLLEIHDPEMKSSYFDGQWKLEVSQGFRRVQWKPEAQS